MFKINIFIGFFAILSGLANLLVGYGETNYSSLDAALAVTQIILALLVVVTGVSRAKWFFANEMVSKSHIPIAIVFYIFVVSVVVFMV